MSFADDLLIRQLNSIQEDVRETRAMSTDTLSRVTALQAKHEDMQAQIIEMRSHRRRNVGRASALVTAIIGAGAAVAKLVPPFWSHHAK